jgi:trigger factor
LKATIKSSDGLKRAIEIEIPADIVDAAFAERYHKYRKEANIKGFRPGKAPLAIIKTKFQEAIRDEVIQELVNDSYPQAIKENGLDVASPPRIPEIDLKEGAPFKYVAEVEVMPVIEKVEYADLTLPKEKIEVKDDELQTVVDYLRKKHSELRTVTRAAQSDDVLTVDLVKLDDPDKILDGDSFENNEVELSSQYTVKELREQLPGMKAGDEKEITVSYPADYSQKKFAGKTVKFKCTVKEVKERILPPMDDSFVKTIGEQGTYLELRLKIRQDLVRQKELDLEKFYHETLRDQILNKNEIPVPQAMVINYLDSMKEDFRKNRQPYDDKTFDMQYGLLAENSLRWDMLMHKLAEQEKIEVLPSDTENWIKGFAERYKMEFDKAKEVLSKSGRNQEIKETILEDKVFDFLKNRAKFVDAPAPEPKKDTTDNSTEEK